MEETIDDTATRRSNINRLHDSILVAAWEAYHERSTSPEAFYARFYLEGKGKQPPSRVLHAIIFLQAWTAWDYRFREDGPLRALEFLPGFIEENSPTIQHLRDRSLLTLEDDDINAIRDLAVSLESGLTFDDGRGPRRAPTAWGKLLHFLAPESILLWDGETVRKGPLHLNDGPDDFAALQRWGRALSRHLEKDRVGGYAGLAVAHRLQRKDSYEEPVTKIIDEAMYDPSTIRQAIEIVGTPYELK